MEDLYCQDTGKKYGVKKGTGEKLQEKYPKISESLPNNVPKSKNVLNLIQNRQLVTKQSNCFDIQFLKLKTESLKLSRSEMCLLRENWAKDILYLKGGDNSLYGLWDVLPGICGHNIVQEIPLAHTVIPVNLGMLLRNLTFADFCDAVFTDRRVFMRALNDLRKNEGRAEVTEQMSDGRLVEHSFGITKEKLVFCCAANFHEKKFAFGSENILCISSVNKNLYSKAISGTVFDLHFNNIGSVLFCGINEGGLVTSDLRTKENCMTKLYNRDIHEVKILEDENRLIIGAIDGALFKFDLRMNGIVAEYIGHNHSKRKTRFSVSNSFNLLCATGADNLTRLWSLDGGTPVSTFRPPLPDEPHRCWLDNYSKSMYCIQKDVKYSCNFLDIEEKDFEVIDLLD